MTEYEDGTETATEPGACARCGGPIQPGMRTADMEGLRFHGRCGRAAYAELWAKSRRRWRRLGKRAVLRSDFEDWAASYAPPPRPSDHP